MVKRMEIIKFKNKQEYEEWLRPRSWAVKQKAEAFKERYGDIVPIIVDVDVDTSQTGEPGLAHLFLHPAAEKFIDYLIG